MSKQIPLGDEARAAEIQDGGLHVVATDIAYQRLGIVNVVYVGEAGAADGEWVLIDAGVYGASNFILRAVEQRFNGSRPAAIVMTHGHFDHVGALETLAERWDVPVVAHPLELPYLNGNASYPPPDPSVGGGMMARLSPLYPSGPVDVASRLQPLTDGHPVPHMPRWRWVHTPGHTPGHISLWRERDRVLIAGDAFISTNQESAYAVAVQEPELHGPPAYFTQDWEAAERSVAELAALEPELAVTGHGRALQGEQLRLGLKQLAKDFRSVAVPAEGRYVGRPARVNDPVNSAYRPA